jgi:hypothetical protein
MDTGASYITDWVNYASVSYDKEGNLGSRMAKTVSETVEYFFIFVANTAGFYVTSVPDAALLNIQQEFS